MLYNTMNAIGVQRFVAAGLLFATAGVVFGKAVDQALSFGARAGLVVGLGAVALASAEIVARLSAATRNLLEMCRQVEGELKITTGLGSRFLDYLKAHPGQTGSDAAILTAYLLCLLTAGGGTALLAAHLNRNDNWDLFIFAVTVLLVVGCTVFGFVRLLRLQRAWTKAIAQGRIAPE